MKLIYYTQVGENYYLPMTTYLESKSSMPPMTMAAMEKEMEKLDIEKSKMLTRTEPPGALGFRCLSKEKVVSRVGLFNLGCYFWLHKFRYAEG